MTFDDFLKASSEQDFLLKEGSVGKKDYVFENSVGNQLHMKLLNNSVADSFPMWTVDIDGDRVQFDNPSQLLTTNTIVTGLITRSIKVFEQRVKEENKAKHGC